VFGKRLAEAASDDFTRAAAIAIKAVELQELFFRKSGPVEEEVLEHRRSEVEEELEDKRFFYFPSLTWLELISLSRTNQCCVARTGRLRQLGNRLQNA
jgi:hypothetical protein